MKHLFIKYSKLIDLTQISLISHYLKKLILFLSPFIMLIILYFIWDPFKLIYNYDNYYQKGDYYIHKNRDFVSSAMYIKNCKKYKYDSFIFGSSTAVFFKLREWRRYLDSASRVFSFDASGENIVGIWSKIKFIHKNNYKIKNALLVFDTRITFDKFKNKGLVFRKHYKIFPSSKLLFHLESAFNFINVKFLVAVFHRKISNHYHPYMKDILEDRYYTADLITNEMIFAGPKQELRMDSLGYYAKRIKQFYPRSDKSAELYPQIEEEHICMLNEILEIFIKDSTDYRIIITPLYNQISFNSQDLRILNSIFGEEKIFNFSGINKYTRDISNYYDPNHFKEYIGSDIMSKIYNPSNIMKSVNN